MTDMEGMMPELTLNADAAKVEAPSLTLSLESEAPAAAAEPEKPKVEPVVIDDSMLNEAEKKISLSMKVLEPTAEQAASDDTSADE